MKRFIIIAAIFIVACSSSDNDNEQERELTSIQINSSNGNQLCESSGFTILSVVGFDQFNEPISTTEPITWSTNNNNVSIDENGNVEALTLGNTIVTASVIDIQATYNITVANTINEVVINTGIRKYVVGLNDSFNINLNILGCPGTQNSEVSWTSSNENILTINSDGSISPLSYGVSEITASVDGVESNSLNIEVFPSNGNAPKEMLEEIIDFMKTWNLPGASIGIVKDERLVYLNALGFKNTETNEAVENNTLFRIASISKPITSTAIFKLVESGLLSLDDNVFGTNGILNQPIYTNNFPDSRVLDITIRDLLYHQGGWDRAIQGDPMFNTVEIAGNLGAPFPATTENIVDYITQSYTLDFNPGTSFKYSNYGYCVLGRVIEKVSGTTYEDYVTTNVLNPVGATGIFLGKNLLEDKHPDEAIYYHQGNSATTTSVYGTGEQVPWPYGGFNIEAMDAHGGWVSNAKELLEFMTSVDGGSIRNDIISSSSLNQTHTPSPNFSSYAMGWEQIGSNWFHTGSVPGTFSQLYNGSNGEAYAIIFNSWPINQQTQFYNDIRPFMLNRLNSITSWEDIDLFD